MWVLLRKVVRTAVHHGVRKHRLHYRNVASTPRLKNSSARSIFLMGPPGAGKTTVASLVGEKLGLPVVDVDDLLEKHWKVSVADKLRQIGDESFLQAEGEILAQMSLNQRTVVSLTGSNPLHADAMKRVQSLGDVIFLDVSHADILSRLSRMKVDRIVGQGLGLADNLIYRQQFYEKTYDVRVLCEPGETPQSISEKVSTAVNQLSSSGAMYMSTRSTSSNCASFQEMVLRGGAPDGGLYVPSEAFPFLTRGELSRLVNLDYKDRALRILEKLIHPRDVPPAALKKFIQAAYSPEAFSGENICPVESLGNDTEFIMELFRGPSASFKDFAVQLLPFFFGHVVSSTAAHCRLNVLISPAQALKRRVEGDFDACQTLVKRLLMNQRLGVELKEQFNTKLSVANSINWLRLLGQIVYHVSGYLDLVKNGAIRLGELIDVCVPSGNFGNALSAVYCRMMGVPLRKLICASNCNNSLTELINTGFYNIASRGTHAKRTVSPAIDILRASNVERYIFHATRQNANEVVRLYRDLETTGRFQVSSEVRDAMHQDFLADWCNDETCLQTISDTYKQCGYLLDPHTAVAKAVGNKFRVYRGKVPLLICSTAHFAKCSSDVLRAVTDVAFDRVQNSSVGTTGDRRAHDSSLRDTLESLDAVLGTGQRRPAMHANLRRTIYSHDASQLTCSVLPADDDLLISHIRKLLN